MFLEMIAYNALCEAQYFVQAVNIDNFILMTRNIAVVLFLVSDPRVHFTNFLFTVDGSAFVRIMFLQMVPHFQMKCKDQTESSAHYQLCYLVQ